MYYITTIGNYFNVSFLPIGKAKNIKSEYTDFNEVTKDLNELNRYSLKKFQISEFNPEQIQTK